VHGAITAAGADRFYRLRPAESGRPAKPSERGYQEMDHPGFQRLQVRAQPDGLLATELYLPQVHCAACVWLLERLPFMEPAVAEARLDLRRGLLALRWDPVQATLSSLARRLDSLGYPPHPASAARQRVQRRTEDRRQLLRIALAGALAGNVMLFAFALYGGAFAGIAREHRLLFRWGSMLLALAALFGPGRLFLRGAVAGLRARRAHMDLPVTLGLCAAAGWSALNTVRDSGEVYFDTVALLIFLLLLGRWLQHRQRRRAQDAIEQIFSLTPAHAHRVVDGGVRDVPLESLEPGDSLRVLAGETIPADGELLEGQTTLDLAVLTGESRPVPARAPQQVQAGTVNLSAPILLRVRAVGEATRLGRLMRLVERAAERRAPVEQLADRVAAWFVMAVLALALLTAGLWLWLDPSRALENAVAMLIVTCPCALGLATPLALVAAVGRAAKRGILIKGGDTLESLASPGLAWLDKTGTLTEGDSQLLRWEGPSELLAAAAALERQVQHPVARAVVRAAAQLPERAASEVQRAQRGVSGRVGEQRIQLGSRAWLEQQGLTIPPLIASQGEAMASDGLSPVLVAQDGLVCGIGGVGDPIRPEAPAALSALRSLGWQPGLLSGDHPQVVAAVGHQLGLPEERTLGQVSPERKLAVVESGARLGPVFMVGDGVNDAAALSAATVGIAVRGGAEASLAAADVYLVRPGLRPLVELVQGARRTMGIIRRNLAVSLAYNLVGASLAMAGLISPLVAAVLMPLSSLTVVTMSYRSRSFPRAPCPSSTSPSPSP